jgi:AcrR family transcriptional regulator
MTRKSKEDWLEEGLLVLSDIGEAGLTIDLLSTRLNVTKGSFYHHFQNRQDFLERMLAHWEYQNTLRFIDITEQEGTPAEKGKRLTELVLSKADDPPIEVAIRAWAMRDELARSFQERVDQRRIAYIQQLAMERGVEPDTALRMAQIAYTVLIGSQHLVPPISRQQYARLESDLQHYFSMALAQKRPT